MTTADIIERVAMAIYADSYTDYGTCTAKVWKRTSEPQRQMMRQAAVAAIAAYASAYVEHYRDGAEGIFS